MKKNVMWTVVLVFAMCLLLAGCGSKNGGGGETAGSTAGGDVHTQTDNEPGNTGTPAETAEPMPDGELEGAFDESTRIYTTNRAGYKVSLLVPIGWSIISDDLYEDAVGAVHMDNGKLDDETERMLLWTEPQGYADAKQTWDEYAGPHVNDLADGQYVTYGNNTYYANVGHPDSMGAVMYYLDGTEKPALVWSVQVKDGHESLAEEVLASLTIG